MHGHEFSFGVHDPSGWWISEKFDGVRAVWNKSEFVSKNGKKLKEGMEAGMEEGGGKGMK